MANLIENAGDAGTSVILVERGARIEFRMQLLTCDRETERALVAGLSSLRQEIRAILPDLRLATQTILRYCPACGTDLVSWASSHPSTARTLVEEHRSFDIDRSS
jgi:hypothetical protein